MSTPIEIVSGCRIQSSLGMSRSLGDFKCKQFGISGEPDVTSHELDSSDMFLVMASDGVWEFITSTEAVQLVYLHLKSGATPDVTCQHLIAEATQRWKEKMQNYRDDVTATVVLLAPLMQVLKANHDTNQEPMGSSTHSQVQRTAHVFGDLSFSPGTPASNGGCDGGSHAKTPAVLAQALANTTTTTVTVTS